MAASERPTFTKVLAASYLNGAALGFPTAFHRACFPATAPCTLRNAAGQEWAGKVMKRTQEGSQTVRVELTSGWGRFAKDNGLAAGDEVQIQHLPGPGHVLMVTVIKRHGSSGGSGGGGVSGGVSGGGSGKAAAAAGRPKGGKAAAQGKTRKGGVAGQAPAAQQQQQEQQHEQRQDQEQRKRPRKEQQQPQQQQGAAAGASVPQAQQRKQQQEDQQQQQAPQQQAQPPPAPQQATALQLQQKQQKGQQQTQQQQPQQEQAALHAPPPFLAPDQLPYIRHNQTSDGLLQQQTQQQQQQQPHEEERQQRVRPAPPLQQRKQLAWPYTDVYLLPGGPQAAVAPQHHLPAAGHASSGSGSGSERASEIQLPVPHAKRRRGTVAGAAAVPAAVAAAAPAALVAAEGGAARAAGTSGGAAATAAVPAAAAAVVVPSAATTPVPGSSSMSGAEPLQFPPSQQQQQSTEEQAAAAAAMADSLVGKHVVLRCPVFLHHQQQQQQQQWVAAHVLEASQRRPGYLLLELDQQQQEQQQQGAGVVAVAPPPPPEPVAKSVSEVAAVLPVGLVGWEMQKRFGRRLYSGTVASFSAEEQYYHVRYEDGDGEDCELHELLPLLVGPPGGAPGSTQQKQQQQAAATAAAARGKKRGRTPKQQQQGGEATRRGRPAKQQHQATLTSGRRGWSSAAAAAAAAGGGLADPSSGGSKAVQQQGHTAVPAAAAVAAVAVAVLPEEAGGFYAAGGAGHERGVLAYDKEAGAMRPVGPWMVDSKRGTVLARSAKLDKRHLPDCQPPQATAAAAAAAAVAAAAGAGAAGSSGDELDEQQQQRRQRKQQAYRSSSVPGWIGVSVAEDGGGWHPGYSGSYQVVFWDTHCATRLKLPSALKDTVEEAARLYDKIAMCYYGEQADTNYPATQESMQQLGQQEEGASRQVIPLAARLLLLEQSMPDAAVAGSVTRREWDEWEGAVLDDFLCKRPTGAAPAALAAKLKWLLQQVHPSALLPPYRASQRLQRFLAACDACCEAGTAKEHYAPDASQCACCACHIKQDGGGRSFHHGMNKLSALLREVEVAILSQEALAQFAKGSTSAAAAAAADREQQELDTRLQQWKEGRRMSSGGSGGDASAPRRQRRPSAGSKAAAAAAAAASAAAAAASGKLAPRADVQLPPGLKVVVIGGGAAGLKAAGDLQRAGAKVTLLEARHRLGGRIHTFELAAGEVKQPVDLGATFVCGTSRQAPVNPLLEYASDILGLKLRPKHRDGAQATLLFDSEGRAIPEAVQLAAEEKYADLLARLLERGVQPNKGDGGGSSSGSSSSETIGDAIESIMQEMQLEPGQRDILSSCCRDLYVALPACMSLRGMVGSGHDGDQELVEGGLSQVVQALGDGRVAADAPASPLRDVRLGSVVRSVRLLPGGVGAEVAVEGQVEPLRAHAVLCTLPLGCLQKGSVRFEPPLPEYKAEAIGGLGMGTENRVAMLFDTAFWPEAPHFLRPISGRYTFSNLHALGLANVLCAWVRPEAVAEVEALSDDEVMEDVEACLRQMFPEAHRAPLTYTVTRWSQDPYCYGAYSYVPPHGKKAYYDWLSYPVSGDAATDAKQPAEGGRHVIKQTRLWFAGEATSKDDACTVHGALTTGRHQAIRIKRWWRLHHQQVQQEQQEQQQEQQQEEQQQDQQQAQQQVEQQMEQQQLALEENSRRRSPAAIWWQQAVKWPPLQQQQQMPAGS